MERVRNEGGVASVANGFLLLQKEGKGTQEASEDWVSIPIRPYLAHLQDVRRWFYSFLPTISYNLKEEVPSENSEILRIQALCKGSMETLNHHESYGVSQAFKILLDSGLGNEEVELCSVDLELYPRALELLEGVQGVMQEVEEALRVEKSVEGVSQVLEPLMVRRSQIAAGVGLIKQLLSEVSPRRQRVARSTESDEGSARNLTHEESVRDFGSAGGGDLRQDSEF